MVVSARSLQILRVEDPQSMKFTWKIDNFTRLYTKKHYSEIFVVGGYKWRILIFPKGNKVENLLSMYLEAAESTTLPYGWSRYAHFSLAVLNQIHNIYSIRKDTQHQFNAIESHCGFASFMPLSDLCDPSRGYLVFDKVIVEAEVSVRNVLDYCSYDSKKETGSLSRKVEDPQLMKFTWKIDNFSRLNTKILCSEIFVVHGCKWRILIFPKGNKVENLLSMYLEAADSTTLPYGWSRYAQFGLAVLNQIHNKYTIRKDTQHQFNARESDWGFTSFMPLRDLHDPSRGYLVNDTVVVEVEVAIQKVLNNRSYDSKKETGHVGLKNQGATCYMNSLLQTLYHIPYFRKAVYHMPITENDMPTRMIPLALQTLFYKLQYHDTSVATKELTKSFGWDTNDTSMMHDVQELNRVLCEKLEDKMKGTVVEGTIQQLFEGHYVNYLECINVDYKSTRKELFYDLQLDVKGCQDVYASFDKYVEIEHLEGDNKYYAKEYGLQDARKAALFINFPPVLQFQLKRFEYDFMQRTTVKINDRYEFPLQLDLDRDNGKYLSPEADRSVRNLYILHSVLVHSGGGVHDGHYYALIRPTLSDQWFKFDDERVTKEDKKRVLEDHYGGEEETNPGFNTRCSNAYMLVYIRESDKDKIICNVDEKDIAEHLRIKLKNKQEEKEEKRRYKEQVQLYTIIKVARDEDLVQQIGRDIYFDLVDHDKVCSFRITKQTHFSHFKEEVAKEFGIPVQFQRFWIWAKRQNHTYRPHRPLIAQDEAQFVGHLREVSNKNNAELKLFLEVDFGLDLHLIPPPEKSEKDILLFFKLYDPEKEELRYVGRLFVKSFGRPIEILEKLNQMAGFAPDEEIELYEEIKCEPSVMCEHVDKKVSFLASQIEDGDIICFQKSPPLESGQIFQYPDVPLFLEYVHNRQIVHFRSLEKTKEDDFCLELSKLHSYDEVVERVASRIGLDDPSKIRLTSHNCYSQQPKPQPIKYRGAEHLSDMLVHYNQMSDILYYEVLDIPLPEIQGLKNLKVAFHHATKDEVVIHNIRLPKQSTVGDVINELKTKVELSHPNAELRLLKVFHHKIYKIFPPIEKIENINDQYWTLRAEEIPEEEKNLGPQDSLIHFYHFTKEFAQNQMKMQNFGEPFFLVIHEGETLAEVKVRIQKKLQVPDEELSKWKFVFLSLGRPEYLQDSDIVFTHFQRRDVYGIWEQYLGLEHSDKRACAVNQDVITSAIFDDLDDIGDIFLTSQAEDAVSQLDSQLGGVSVGATLSHPSINAHITAQVVGVVQNDAPMTFEEHSSRGSISMFVDWEVKAEHVVLLEKYREKYGDFWLECEFISSKIMSTLFDMLGETLLMTQKPWNSVSLEDLNVSTIYVKDLCKAKFKVDYLKSYVEDASLVIKQKEKEDECEKTRQEYAVFEARFKELERRLHEQVQRVHEGRVALGSRLDSCEIAGRDIL